LESLDELYEKLIKMKMELPSNGVIKQAMGKGFGIDLPSVVIGSERIQNSAQQWRQKCYRTDCSLGKSPTQATSVRHNWGHLSLSPQ
jgi:hypothetical protein